MANGYSTSRRLRRPALLKILQIEMKQDGPRLVIKSKYQEPKNAIYPLLWVGIMTYELELTTDGTEKVNQIGPFAHNSRPEWKAIR